MRIVHDTSRCSSLGICEAIAPELFQVGNNGELTLCVSIDGVRTALVRH